MYQANVGGGIQTSIAGPRSALVVKTRAAVSARAVSDEIVAHNDYRQFRKVRCSSGRRQ